MNSRAEYYKVLISPYLKEKLQELESKYSKDSWEYKSIALQYEFDSREDEDSNDKSLKHYEASAGLINVERLYKHHCCVEINFSCPAHCRYCLRSNYDGYVITDEQMQDAVNFMRDNRLDEVLITGGDPFLSLGKLDTFLQMIVDQVPTMNIIRIATRTFTQNPAFVRPASLVLAKYNEIKRVEVATQIASPIELTWKETINAFKSVLDLGIPVYSQNVFLKGVNDEPEHLIELYERMRQIGITPHYLFNCCPLVHIHHFRPSLKKMIECYEMLVNSGAVTGRSKPILALMTSIGKITLTPFNVIKYVEGEYIELSSKYKLEDRLKYNPSWKMPEDAWENEDGYLCVRYIDGED
jgi:lysine 2,3-aminomutase